LIIANSYRTKCDLVEFLDICPDKIRVVHLGIDAAEFRPIDKDTSTQVRGGLGLDPNRPVASFVGSVDDSRKGFDTLYQAWRDLCKTPSWDVQLLVIGSGRKLALWRRRAEEESVPITFAGFREDVPILVAASDLLVSPSRYESFGLAIQEALSAGTPALVSSAAGVTELFDEELREFLIGDPQSVSEVVDRLKHWRQSISLFRKRSETSIAAIRARSWDHMAKEIATSMAELQ
jgi:glycosyltransferase involved in cell wall biosynthesis